MCGGKQRRIGKGTEAKGAQTTLVCKVFKSEMFSVCALHERLLGYLGSSLRCTSYKRKKMYQRECDSKSERQALKQKEKSVYIRFMFLQYIKNILLNKMSYTVGLLFWENQT